MKKILVVAAHPDDDVLGCGGTISKFARQGADIHVMFLADGVFSRYGNKTNLQINYKNREQSGYCSIIKYYKIN